MIIRVTIGALCEMFEIMIPQLSKKRAVTFVPKILFTDLSLEQGGQLDAECASMWEPRDPFRV